MHASRRHLASAVIIGVSAVVVGCSGSPTPEATPSIAPAAESSPSPSPIERPDVPAPPEQLTFEAGADLDPAVWLAGWHEEPIDMSHGYAVVQPRDDWQEIHLSDGCEGSRYHRFSLDDLDDSLNDRELTNQFLADLLEMPLEDIANEGSDVSFPVVGRWPMAADFRVRAGSWSDGGTWLTAARVFGALDTALVIQLDCDPGPMTGARGQQMFEHLPVVMGMDALSVGLGRVDANVVENMGFDDGDDLVSSSGGRWVDPVLMDDAAWIFDDGAPDDGAWSFVAADGDCTAEYVQSLLEEDDGAAGDRGATDDYLAWMMDTDRFEPDSLVDSDFALGVPGNDLIAVRLIEGADADGRWVTIARALTGPSYGFMLTVTCEKGEPMDALELLRVKTAIQVVP